MLPTAIEGRCAWIRPAGEQITARTLCRVRPGSILVFHDAIPHGHAHSRPQTAEALSKIAPELLNIQAIGRRRRHATVAMYLSPVLKRLGSDCDDAVPDAQQPDVAKQSRRSD